MSGAGRGTHREIVLAHLAKHPDLTAYELENATGAKGSLLTLLRSMERQALVASTLVHRPGQGQLVNVWRIAPAGACPSPGAPESPDQAERRRARQRAAYQRARQLQLAVAVAMPALPGAACRGADPEIFFPALGDAATEAAALAFCQRCPAQAACEELALANGEKSGVWGGVNLERPRRQRQAS